MKVSMGCVSPVCCWLLCWVGAGLNGNSEFQSFEKQMKSFTLFNCSEKLLFIWEDPSQKLALHHRAVIGDPRENDSFMMYLCSLHSSLAILQAKRPRHKVTKCLKYFAWKIFTIEFKGNFLKFINACLGFNVEGARVACVYVPSHLCNPLMNSVLFQPQSSSIVHFYIPAHLGPPGSIIGRNFALTGLPKACLLCIWHIIKRNIICPHCLVHLLDASKSW